MKPLLLINFKAYAESTGDEGVLLAQKIASVRSEFFEIAIAPSLVMLGRIAREVKVPLFSPHLDGGIPGAHTGSVLAQELHQIGVKGVMLNHAENQTEFKTIAALREQAGLKVLICAATLDEVRKMASLRPEYIAYEPRELIGGKISVIDAKPDIIAKAVEVVQRRSPKTRLLCGAGVHSRGDLQQALKLGAKGVLLSSAVVKAKDPVRFLREMVSTD